MTTPADQEKDKNTLARRQEGGPSPSSIDADRALHNVQAVSADTPDARRARRIAAARIRNNVAAAPAALAVAAIAYDIALSAELDGIASRSNRSETDVLEDIQAAGADTLSARRARFVAETRLRSAHGAMPIGAVLAEELARPDALSNEAAAVELRRGQASAERIVIEVGGPLIDRATSWADLHAALAKEGISYETKGSGAVMRIGPDIVKASAYRKASFKALEKRLGPFEPSTFAIISREPQPAPGTTPILFAAVQARAEPAMVAQAATAEQPVDSATRAVEGDDNRGGSPGRTPDIQKIAAEVGEPMPTLAPIRRPAPPPHDPTSMFGRLHAATGADHYRLIFPATSSARPSAGQLSGTIDEVASEFATNAEQAAALSCAHTELFSNKSHHVVVRGINGSGLDRLIADGYKPAAVIRRAGGTFEALLNAPKTTERFRDMAALFLERWLTKLYGRASRRDRGTRRTRATLGRFVHNDYSAIEGLSVHGERVVCEKTSTLIERTARLLRLGGAPSAPERVIGRMLERLAKAGTDVTSYSRHLSEAMRSRLFVNASRREGFIARFLRFEGKNKDEVTALIRTAALLTDPVRRFDPFHYAGHIADHAFSTRADAGMVKIAKLAAAQERAKNARSQQGADKRRVSEVALPGGGPSPQGTANDVRTTVSIQEGKQSADNKQAEVDVPARRPPPPPQRTKPRQTRKTGGQER